MISSACPAIVRLIQIRYPNLIPNLIPIKSPMEIAAQNARREFCKMYDVLPEEVGVFFLSPCAAKMTSTKAPLEVELSNVDGVIPIKMVYFKLLKQLVKMRDENVEKFYSKPENTAFAGLPQGEKHLPLIQKSPICGRNPECCQNSGRPGR